MNGWLKRNKNKIFKMKKTKSLSIVNHLAIIMIESG